MDYIEFVKASYLEMLCDWFSFNFLEHHTDDAQKFHEWWAENKSTIIILPELNEWFTNYVNILINKSQDIKQMAYQEPVEEDELDWLTDDLVEDIRHNADNQITLDKQFTLVIDDEYEAIKGYDTFLETVRPLVDSQKYNQMFSVVNHIRAEEREHIEELKKLQNEIS